MSGLVLAFPDVVSQRLNDQKTGCRADADPPGCGAGVEHMAHAGDDVNRMMAGVVAVRRWRCRRCGRVWAAAQSYQ